MEELESLGVDEMGYQSVHLLVRLRQQVGGARYEKLKELTCEIQVRTVVQDAWAIISHHLVYKNEKSVPARLRRDLNNTSSLLEIAQSVFDAVRTKRDKYIEEIQARQCEDGEFLDQPVDYDTLNAYSLWKFPELSVSAHWQDKLLQDLNLEKSPTLRHIDHAVRRAADAVEAFRGEDPDVFGHST
ncbi:MAG: hypothetical protein IH867_11840, partial [Chloroflexi bacterium]|nr:hypothetical protein [Chloroflexota bacterium]